MTYRVVQWTTGKTGSAAVRGIIAHPQLELVGCYAWSADKAGQDAGTLSGIDPLGVIATDDIDALLALAPDCVSYMPYRPDIDHVVRILEAGVNVVSTMYMLSGIGYGDDAHARIVAACERGGSSLYTSGVYPGHAPMVALAASAMFTRVDCISVQESLDMSGYRNEQMYRAMSIDREVDDPEVPGMIEANCGSFKDQIRVMAIALGIEIDEIGFHAEFATADEDLDFGFMTVGKGRIAGFKGFISGLVDGTARVQCRFVWKLGDENMTPNWPVEHGYRIEIEGDQSLTFLISPTGEHFDGTVTTAMPCVNAIPRVVEAPAGIVNRQPLPLVTGTAD